MSFAPRVAAAVALLAASACSAPKAAPDAEPRSVANAAQSDEGYITVPGGRVWYHRVGTGRGTPVLLLHGGPGGGSYYLKPLFALGDDRPVILYDQLGAGKSDQPTDTSLYTVARYVKELQLVRDSLGLTEVHLYGHSWGSMLAEAYMGTNPPGVKSLVLSSPLVTTAQWEADADTLVRALPDSMEAAIVKHEAAGTTDSPEYTAAMDAYSRLYLMRTPARSPADVDSMTKQFGKLVYNYMWGPSEFTSTGTLKKFDATAWLRNVKVPTLFVTGEFDEATPSSTKAFARLVPGAEFRAISGSGHMTHNDNPDEIIAVLRDFFRRADGAR